MDAEEEEEPQAVERSPKRPRVETEPVAEVAVSGDAAEEGPTVDGATAVVTVRSPSSSSRIPRPVGNPVASSSFSEVVT